MKSAGAAIVVGLLLGVVAIQIARTDASTYSQKKANKKNAQEYLAPIVDYELDYRVAAVAEPTERKLREARGRRYNERASDPLGDLPSNWSGFATGTDWYVGVPALPMAQSDAVIVGEVTTSEAHLSNDRTGVYSEFSIRVIEVLKNHFATQLGVGDVTVGEREGGIVRFQDGRLFEYMVYHQGMPRPGRKYLFFMNGNKQGEDYVILTAYELSRGQVTPLDDSPEFASYKGSYDQEFLSDVRRAIGSKPHVPGQAKEEK